MNKRDGTALDPAASVIGLRLADLLGLRLSVGQILGGGAMLTGPLLASTGALIEPFAPTFEYVPGWPWLYGGVLTVAGFAMLWATPRREHRIAQIAAAACAAVFGLALAGPFIALWVVWLTDDIPGNAASPPYMAVPYLLLTALYRLEADVEGRAHNLARQDAVARAAHG